MATSQLKIKNIKLERVECNKFLGIYLNDKLNWNKHLNKKAYQISKVIGILNKVKSFLTKHLLKLIYFTLVNSHLLYGLLYWSNSKFSNKNGLVTLQKKAIRIVNGSSYLAHTEPIFKNLKILKLSDLYIMQGIKHFCSITEGNSLNYISNNVNVSS